ncbi:MAG: lamin tail domain-containing protein [Undibacterium sp.]
MAPRSVFYTTLITTFLLIPLDVFASVILSEVQIEGEKAADEFVELYNNGNDLVNLSGWSLRKKSAADVTTKGSSLKTFGSSDTVPAHGYFLWANSGSIFKDMVDTTTSSSLSDNNSLALYDKSGALIDSLTWGSSHALPYSPTLFDNPNKKEGFTRDLTTLTWSKTKAITPTNSKGEVYKEVVVPSIPPEPSPFTTIFINEVLPNPKEKNDAGEFIELYNPGSSTVDLSGWEIHDASTTGKYIFPSGKSIAALNYLVVTDQDFTLSLNNSIETLTLWDKDKRLVHEVKYEKTKEGIALGLVGGTLRGMRVPTPGAVNSENAEPVTKERVPKKSFRGFATEFRARSKDSDGDQLKFTWDFGDGHKSYKENISHKYLKSGRYTVTLTTDDGIDTTTETFDIKIEKYRAPKVRITSFIPNPKGNDSELEWIEIENHEKREVNLKGFSIATGTKKKSITNHPIREDFIIPAKSTKKLTREFSLFALGNVRGHIELRAPDGTVIQDLKYKFDKSLKDGVVLKKEKGRRLETITPTNQEETTETNTPQTPISNEEPKVETTLPPESTSENVTSPIPTENPSPDTPTQLESETVSEENIEPETSTEEVEVKESSPLVSTLQSQGKKFISILFGLDISESKNILAEWGDALNIVLNEWLADTAVATRQPE